MRRRRRVVEAGPLGAAGWLFAELALLLVVVVAGSEAPPVAAPTTAAPPPTTPGGPPPTEGLSLTTVKFVMPVVPDAEAAQRFSALMTERIGPDGKVGLVLLFGISPTGNLSDGARVSGHLKGLIEAVDIPQLRTRNDIRAYIGSGNDGLGGETLVELFLLNGPS
ncbi:hypothetical protein [Saccharothrix algeriensis]|uniref:Secreted protein n=1 Tax=Saccharothrix algeriensis TaxID=173560 RepID=A0ABS2SEL9_9PSEU|nr:hypothetical protein [Saccharothrix algeriensis]MBM7814712.1 hypothetical protein [Saccharothrix algeriensis]